MTHSKKVRQKIQPQDIEAARDPDALLTVQVVSALTGYSVETIRKKARRPESGFPAPHTVGQRNVRWRAGEIRQWLIEQGIASEVEAALRADIAVPGGSK